MNVASGNLRWLCWVGLLCTVLTSCSDDQYDRRGDSIMFGLFGGKRSVKHVTTLAAEVGSELQRHSSLPAHMTPAVKASYAACQTALIRGIPPDAEWVPGELPGESRRVFVVPSAAGQPALALLNGVGNEKHLQVWELSDQKPSRFVKPRSVVVDAAQASWLYDYPAAVSCLPCQQVLLSIGYNDPAPKEALYVYSPSVNRFRRIAEIEPEMSSGPPFISFETLAAAPEVMLVLYHTEVLRLSAGDFAYGQDHILLFSPRYPQGLEILKLCIDDGNVRGWAMQGKVLLLQTRDKRRKAADFIWSLDLSNVL